jgi:aspartokinase-like uncharacterized kinase
VVRDLDRCHHLGEETSHWLALRGLQLNAHFLAHVLPSAEVIEDWRNSRACWERGRLPILDAYSHCLTKIEKPNALQASWSVTSDSIAAHVAQEAGARQLILLKSVTFPSGMDWNEASQQGFVDPHFAKMLNDSLQVSAINFRDVTPTADSSERLAAHRTGPP